MESMRTQVINDLTIQYDDEIITGSESATKNGIVRDEFMLIFMVTFSYRRSANI